VTLAMAQLAGRKSLRDIVENISVQAHRLYQLNSSTIDLCLSVFPWATFHTTKSAIKLHVGLNHNGYLPEFVAITEGKTSDIEIGRTLQFPQGSIVAVDRGHCDYG